MRRRWLGSRGGNLAGAYYGLDAIPARWTRPLSDVGEVTTPQIWARIRDWANSHQIGRMAFWAVNRDRPNWEFTRITAGFTG